MKKLHLNVDALRVESFTTQPQERGTGTVRAHETNAGSCFSDLCFPTDFCGTFGCGTAFQSCRAADCTHVD